MADAESQFLENLFRGVTDDAALEHALQLIQDMFHCSSGALLWVNAHAPETNIAVVSGIFNEHGRLYLNQFAQIDPAPRLFSRLTMGTASTTDRLMTPEERDRDTFYNEFFRPIGLVETLGGTMFSDDARFSLIGLQRAKDRRPFDDGDIVQLERLMPLIARALQLRRAFLNADARGLGLEVALNRMPTGVAVYGTGNDVIFVNAAMQAMARRGDGIALDRAGRLMPANLAARRSLEAQLHAVANGGAGGLVIVPRPSKLRDYSALVAPCPIPVAVHSGVTNGRAGAIVLVHDPDNRQRGAAETLEIALRLPKGAARLVAALAADDDLKSYADREGITIHTARFHLRTALARTETRTQAELVRLAVRLLRDVALGPSES